MDQATKIVAMSGSDEEMTLKPFAYTPSEFIACPGKEINNEDSVL